MLKSIRGFFEKRMEPAGSGDPEARARVAAAALLVEVVRSDHEVPEVERQAVLESVGRKFALEESDARALVEMAEAEAKDAHDLFQFTSLINAGFSPAQKVRLIEELWRVAWADDALHRYEEHLIRRVADLLHVSHSAFIAAKLRVQDARPP